MLIYYVCIRVWTRDRNYRMSLFCSATVTNTTAHDSWKIKHGALAQLLFRVHLNGWLCSVGRREPCETMPSACYMAVLSGR